MRPSNLTTKIFLDSGDPKETAEVVSRLGFLDGQTTNPTLIAKNPEVQAQLHRGKKFTKQEIYDRYQDVVKDISRQIPGASISIEVYADHQTTAGNMLDEARMMWSWVPHAHIKFPTTLAGLQAAEQAIKEGIRVNMTLCFTQDQAAAVYAATKGAHPGDALVSPFVGRLDDQGENGMDLIKNILRMYSEGDGHIHVLTASVRNLDHFLYALALHSDVITAPAKILLGWAEKGLPIPDASFQYPATGLSEIPYRKLSLGLSWASYNISHELTARGIDRFANDWNSLIVNE